MEMNERMTDDDSLEYLLLAVVTEATRANDQSRQLEGRGILSVLQENQQLLQHQIQELSQFLLDIPEEEYQSRFEKIERLFRCDHRSRPLVRQKW